MTLKELADATQDAADVALATWQRITSIAALLRGAADAQQADKKTEPPVTWRQALGDDLPGDA